MRFPVFPSLLLSALLADGQEAARLPFHPTASLPTAGLFSITESHRFAHSIAPYGDPNIFRHALGMDRFGNTSMELSGALFSRLQFIIDWESHRQTVGAGAQFAGLRQEAGSCPISAAFSFNVEARTQGVEKDKKYSAGGALTLQRSFFDAHWILSASALGQSHTNTDAVGTKPAHSIAAGVGLIRRGASISTFADFLFPVRRGNTGYRYTYQGRAEKGISPMAFGAGFRLWRGELVVSASNTSSMLASNFLAGADEPTASRLMEWRLGLDYRYDFAVWKGAGP